MNKKPTHVPSYTPERIKELVERMAVLRQRWLIMLRVALWRKLQKLGELSDRLDKLKDWPKRYRG